MSISQQRSKGAAYREFIPAEKVTHLNEQIYLWNFDSIRIYPNSRVKQRFDR